MLSWYFECRIKLFFHKCLYSITYYCSIHSNSNYSVDDKVGNRACPPDPWQHNYSKIYLNLAILFKIKVLVILRNKNKGKLNNQAKCWVVLSQGGVWEKEERLLLKQTSLQEEILYSNLAGGPFVHFMVCSAHQPPYPLQNSQSHSVALPACFYAVLN